MHTMAAVYLALELIPERYVKQQPLRNQGTESDRGRFASGRVGNLGTARDKMGMKERGPKIHHSYLPPKLAWKLVESTAYGGL